MILQETGNTFKLYILPLVFILYLFDSPMILYASEFGKHRIHQGRPPDRYACVPDEKGHCIFTGNPHANGLKPGTNQIFHRNGKFLFNINETVAANSLGKILRASGRPAFDGDRMIKASTESLTNDEKAFHRTMAIMFPIRNALMYDIDTLKQNEWELLVRELKIRKIKETTFTGGPTPRDNYYGRQGIFELAKNAQGMDIHHEVMKFLEESGIFLLCHLTSTDFNRRLKDTHPEGHDPCKKAKKMN